MDFSSPQPPRRIQVLLPMINVVFLLIIFFLLAGRIDTGDPLPVERPELAHDAGTPGDLVLAVAADGRIGFADNLAEDASPASDARVLEALTAARAELCAARDCDVAAPRLTLHADRNLDAGRVADLLPRLAAMGFADVDLGTLDHGAAR